MLEFYVLVGKPDYLSNNMPRSFPKGLDLEIMTPSILYEMHLRRPSQTQSKGATLCLYNLSNRFRIANFPCPFGNYGWARAVIDTESDYNRLLSAQTELERWDPDYDYLDVLNLVSLNPQIFELKKKVG